MANPTDPATIPFQQVIEALQDVDKPFAPRFLYRFSDIGEEELAQLKPVWKNIPLWRRKALLEDIEQLGLDDTLLSFDALGRFVIVDDDPEVRRLAVQILWEYEEPDLATLFMSLIDRDPDVDVQAAAVSGLGRFIYAGELEEIPQKLFHKIESKLLSLIDNTSDDEIQRNALESLGYSSRDEIAGLIEKAEQSGDKNWIASALLAMGRSADPVWKPQVMEMLDSRFPNLRAEAARAAGELELTAARPRLIELLDDPDENTRLASIWSLSQLGGENVHQILEQLYEGTDDEGERSFIESALDNLTFNEEIQLLPMFDLSDTNDHESTQKIGNDYHVNAYEEDFDEGFSEGFSEDLDEDFEDDIDNDGFDDLEEELDWVVNDDEEMDEDMED